MLRRQLDKLKQTMVTFWYLRQLQLPIDPKIDIPKFMNQSLEEMRSFESLLGTMGKQKEDLSKIDMMRQVVQQQGQYDPIFQSPTNLFLSEDNRRSILDLVLTRLELETQTSTLLFGKETTERFNPEMNLVKRELALMLKKYIINNELIATGEEVTLIARMAHALMAFELHFDRFKTTLHRCQKALIGLRRKDILHFKSPTVVKDVIMALANHWSFSFTD